MSTYLLLDAAFLGVVVVVAIIAVALRRSIGWRAVTATAGVLVLTTAVFDNIIVGLGIVAYDPRLILGVKVGVAPVEDFAYALAASLLLPTLWNLLPDSRSADARAGTRAAVRRGGSAVDWDERRP